MATAADFQELDPKTNQPVAPSTPRAEFVAAPSEDPNITKHDPTTYAGLTAQKALETLYAQGLYPTGDDIKGIFHDALKEANQYHAHQAEQRQAAQTELEKRVAALSPQMQADVKAGRIGLAAAEATTSAAVETEKTKALEQFKETGEIHRAAQTDEDRVNGFVNGYLTADTLQKYHHDMTMTTPGAGGFLKSNIMGFITQPDITSQPAKDFHAYLESAIVPLGRGVFGDAATAATKESIQANMRQMLSNKDDNLISAGHKTWMLKDRIMQNLITDRATAVANHKDPAIWDQAIGRLIGDYNNDQTRQFAPGFVNNPGTNAVVQYGNSDQANATINSVNAAAAAGVQAPPRATNAGASAMPPAYGQPASIPSVSPSPGGYAAPPPIAAPTAAARPVMPEYAGVSEDKPDGQYKYIGGY